MVTRDVDDLVRGALVLGVPEQALHREQVDDTLEVGLDAPRKLDDSRCRGEPVDHHVDAAVELGADPVHLVDERDPRDVVAVSLAPDGLALRLDSGYGIEDRDSTVEDPQRALHLDREVDMPRGIDDVDGVVAPRTGGGGGGDGDPPLLLLFHPVHGGTAIVDFADLVVDAGVEKDPLGGRGLARVNMGHDPDVAGRGQRGRYVSRHIGYQR